MQSNFAINKWFCLAYILIFAGFVVVGCSQEDHSGLVRVVLADAEPVRPSRSLAPEPATEAVRSQPARPAAIIMYESEGCVWCKFWWSANRANWEKAGWKVERKDRKEFAGSDAPSGVPFFEVWDTEKTFLVTKLLDYKAYKEAGGK